MKKKLTNDDTRDIAINITDRLVEEGLIKDCIDTDDELEFLYQDIIHEELNKFFHVKENKNNVNIEPIK